MIMRSNLWCPKLRHKGKIMQQIFKQIFKDVKVDVGNKDCTYLI